MSNITQNLIIETFLRLLEKKDLQKITIKELAALCEINRNTFYYHFKDLYDLLETVFRIQAQEVKEACIKHMPWQENMLRSMSFALEHKEALYHLYESPRRDLLESYLYNVIGEVMERYIMEQAEGMEIENKDLLLIVDFYKYALVGILLEWIRGGMQDDPRCILEKVGVLFDGSIGKALLRLKKN